MAEIIILSVIRQVGRSLQEMEPGIQNYPMQNLKWQVFLRYQVRYIQLPVVQISAQHEKMPERFFLMLLRRLLSQTLLQPQVKLGYKTIFAKLQQRREARLIAR